MPSPLDVSSFEAIGRRLLATRLALGFESQLEFATAAGVSPQALNNYERGRSRPSLEIALSLCDRFGLTLDWIYRGDAGGLPHRLAQTLTQTGGSSYSQGGA
jgi:DNA-binding XRE family transcriptional regulator